MVESPGRKPDCLGLSKPLAKDRDTNFYLRGPWAYRVRSEEGQNLEGGLGDANLCSSIQTDITGKSTLRCTHP